MLLYYLFWMLVGLFIHLYIIFGTNLLTQGPVQIAIFFAYFSVLWKKNIKRNETFGRVIFGTNVIQGTWSGCQATNVEVTRQGARPPPSWAPRGSTDLLLPPIYIHIPRKHPGAPRNPISTAATFCTQEIPSSGLFRSSAGGGTNHGGPLHQLHGPSDDV